MSQISQQSSRVQIGALQVAIAACIAATALVYLYVAILPDEDLRFWFLLNGLAYLGWLALIARSASRIDHTHSFTLARLSYTSTIRASSSFTSSLFFHGSNSSLP